MNARSCLIFTLACTAGVIAQPQSAEACGGTFCDAGPNAMPVDQTGEVVLFVMNGESTEAHIQIAYDPEAEASTFAWIVPMQALPEFEVGSQPLFDALLAGTVPAYGFSTTFDDCGNASLSGSGSLSSTGAGDDGGFKLDLGGPPSEPDVVLHQTVGAFEITVLDGGTAEGVMTWLGDNGYQQDPAAEPILEEYLAEGYLFAAFKLSMGSEVAEIHPVVLRFPIDEACVPLRLTRIAAVDDMNVRTFFLADSRVVPQNYRHVLVNPLRLDWPNLAANYRDVITMAVDAEGADGRAFVTEYAGASSVVSTFGVFSDAWNPAAFATIEPVDVANELANQGLLSCFDNGDGPTCQPTHALLDGILREFLPPPPDVEASVFWGCLSCYAEDIDGAAWDGAAFGAMMQDRVVAPGAHAAAVVDEHAVLTRMFTTISPAEMTEDPFFWANPALPDVVLTNELATRRQLCNGDDLWTLPDGREVYLPQGASWPAFDDQMPYELEVANMPQLGAPLVVSDRRAVVDTELSAYNCQFPWPTPAACGMAEGGVDGSDSSGSGGGGLDDRASGCGCNAQSSAPWWASVVLLGFARRRRARA